MSSGSSNALYLQGIIEKIDQGGMVQGAPGGFQVQVPAAAPNAKGGGSVISAGETALVQNAIARTNGAVAPAGVPPIGAITAAIDAIASGLTKVAGTPADVKALVAGSTGELHWWGWTLKLNETATQALLRLLQADLAGLLMIATTLAGTVPALAATAAILGAVAGGLSGWITAEDNAQKGVVIHGYLWVGVWVQPAG